MIYAEVACLTGIILVGAISAYADFRTGNIPNKIVLIGLAYGALCHIALLLLNVGTFYPYWFLCMILADTLALSMYFGKLWAAGDAKLFITLFFLTPPRLFDHGQIANCIIPYIFIFLPALLWMLGDSAIRAVRKEPRKHQIISIKTWLINCIKTIIETTALHSILYAIAPSFVENNPLFVFSMIMVYAYVCGSFSHLRHWPIVLFHLVVIVVIWIIFGWRFSFPDFRGYLILVIILFIQRFAGLYNYQQILTERITKGMIPAAETVILFKPSRIQNLPTDISEQLTARLSEDQAEAVRKWGNSTKGKQVVWIVRKVPFAFMIALGFIVWIIIWLAR